MAEVAEKELEEYVISSPSYIRDTTDFLNKINEIEQPVYVISSPSYIRDTTDFLNKINEIEQPVYVISSPSYIRDTTDFLNKINEIEQPVPENSILFCLDVVQLYPSIPRKEGSEACWEALESRNDKEIGSEQVLDMIDTVLKNNIFHFKGKDYTQTDGVAIGSILGRNYACSYMRKWDEKLTECNKQPYFYKRYIDDIFGIWTGDLKSLKGFHEFANHIHPNIKLELRSSGKQIEFLDTMVILEDGIVKTDLYVKPTDKHLYVQAKSCHPGNVKKSIPYGILVRLKRICSDEKDYKRHRNELKVQLRKRGYSSKFIENQLQRVDGLNRENLLQKKTRDKKPNDRVPLVVTYSAQLPVSGNIVRKNMHILHKSDRLKEVFKNPPIIAFRRDRNLGDVLVHGILNRLLPGKWTGCSKIDCPVCRILTKSYIIRDTLGEREFRLSTSNHDCNMQDVVYGLSCRKCEKIVYVGETERRLKDRITEHQADIRHNKDKPVATHFNDREHTIDDLQVTVLERIVNKSRYYRQIKEINWIDRLKTTMPNGINTKQGLGILWKQYK